MHQVTNRPATAATDVTEFVTDLDGGQFELILSQALTQRAYTDKSGAEKISHEVRMQEMKMLGGRDGDQQQRPAPAARPAQAPAAGGTARPPARPPSEFDDMDDDIPFDQVARAHHKNAHLPAH